MITDNKLHCTNCGASIQSEWRYCLNCGESIPEKHCVNCGRAVANDWDYCPKCGSQIPGSLQESTSISHISSPDRLCYDEDIPF